MTMMMIKYEAFHGVKGYSLREDLESSILNIESKKRASERSCISPMGFFVHDSLSFEAHR